MGINSGENYHMANAQFAIILAVIPANARAHTP
jgi:hypothetical protein